MVKTLPTRARFRSYVDGGNVSAQGSGIKPVSRYE